MPGSIVKDKKKLKVWLHLMTGIKCGKKKKNELRKLFSFNKLDRLRVFKDIKPEY